jgi:hypothetical protein
MEKEQLASEPSWTISWLPMNSGTRFIEKAGGYFEFPLFFEFK